MISQNTFSLSLAFFQLLLSFSLLGSEDVTYFVWDSVELVSFSLARSLFVRNSCAILIIIIPCPNKKVRSVRMGWSERDCDLLPRSLARDILNDHLSMGRDKWDENREARLL